MTVLQMGIAPAPVGHRAGGIVTALFAVVPLAPGILTLRLAVAGAPGKGARVKLALAGALGLLFWGGLIVGPVLAFLAAALPARAFADSPPHSK